MKPDPLTFSGCCESCGGLRRYGGSTSWFTVSLLGEHIKACASKLFVELGIPNPVIGGYAWGYDGAAPQALAATILAVYAGVEPSPMAHSYNWLRAMVYVKDKYPDARRSQPFDFNLVKDNYQRFTTEVIAHLPDKWTITMEEVERWLKDGTLPDCIKTRESVYNNDIH